MIRLILILLDFIFIGICSLFAFPISQLIGVFNKRSKDMFCLCFAKFALKSFNVLAGNHVTYKGLENLPHGGEAVVYIGNHRGFFDVTSTYTVMPDLTGFIAKKEMKYWPLIGWWMNSVYCIFLDRENRREGLKSIVKGIEYVKKGISMMIYPEGTRSHYEGVIGKFHSGSFKLAIKPKVKIIPVVSNNTSAIFEDHKPWIKSARTMLEFCEPIETEGLSEEELTALPERVHSIIQERAIKNGKELGSLPPDFTNIS